MQTTANVTSPSGLQSPMNLDFRMLNMLLSSAGQTPNQFLNPTIHNLEVNQFEKSFQDSKQDPSPQTETRVFNDCLVWPSQSTNSNPQQQNWTTQRRTSLLHEKSGINERRFSFSEKPYVKKRSQSFSSDGSVLDETRASFLERNRKAAMKCRQKKKNYLANLEKSVAHLTHENELLKAELRKLQARGT